MIQTGSGMQYEDLVEGAGESPRERQICLVHFTCWTWRDGAIDQKYASSHDDGQPVEVLGRRGRLPLPVGASINVCRPAAMLAQPRAWTSVGSAKPWRNHVRVAGPNGASGSDTAPP